MTRTPIPLIAEDLTEFSRALARQLGDASPSHLSLMNMLARAAGFQNLQHMRAIQAAGRRAAAERPETMADARAVARAEGQFDAQGRLKQWPARQAVQTLALWALWAALPPERIMDEREVNARLGEEHLFGDPATLRRTMIAAGLLTRNTDGSDYRRIERTPPAEAKALIRAVTARRRARAAGA